jgi:hypothetical protein
MRTKGVDRMFDLPKIKIDVENMRYQIVHAFSSHNKEIEKAVDEELKRALENYPFADRIRVEAYDCITKAIHNAVKEYFLYGDGYKTINEIVTKTIKGSIDNDPPTL